ncbi:MAG: carboxypeptidase regulatory-like domain-containing protein [bacterium]|nr:carboxypeptidase regulatory-like domain-containing protein [bacterium]
MLGGIPIRTAMRTALAVALATGCALAGTAETRTDLPTLDEVVAGLPRHDLSGTVVDEDGAPVRGAEVFLYYMRNDHGLRNRLAGRAKTGRKGRFKFTQAVVWEPIMEFDNERGGRYAVIAKHKRHGINFQVVLEQDISPGNTAYTDITVRMREPREEEMMVKDAEGNRLEGARVFLVEGVLENGKSQELAPSRRHLVLTEDIGLSSGVTDKLGRVTLAAVLKGAAFRAKKDGYTAEDGSAARNGGAITLYPAARMSGVVRQPDGTPLPGAAVWIRHRTRSIDRMLATTSNDRGEYGLAAVPANVSLPLTEGVGPDGSRGFLLVIAEDLRPGSALRCKREQIEVPPSIETEQDLAFLNGATIRCRVRDWADGSPAPGVEIDIIERQPDRTDRGRTWNVTPDDQGRISFLVTPGLTISMNYTKSTTGAYILDDGGGPFGSTGIRSLGAFESDTEGPELFVPKLLTHPLKGRVVDEAGRGVAGATVWVCADVPHVATDANGTFRLKAVPADRDFDLLAVSSDGSRMGAVRMEAGSVSAEVPIAAVREYDGAVSNEGGLPAGNLSFRLAPRLNGTTLHAAESSHTTDAEGQCRLGRLCPDVPYRAWWAGGSESNRDYGEDDAPVDVAAAGPGEPVRFVARQYVNALMGKVVDKGGNPVKDARLWIADGRMSAEDPSSQKIRTDDAGEFTVSRLADGDVVLMARADGFRNRMVCVRSDAVDAVVDLHPLSDRPILRVSVRDEKAEPVTNAGITIRQDAQHGVAEAMTYPTVYTDANGRADFEFPLPEKGRLYLGTVVCDAPGYNIESHWVNLASNAEIRFMLRPEESFWRGRVIDASGSPVEGAEVVVAKIIHKDARIHKDGLRYSIGTDTSVTSPETFTTAADGRFVLHRIGSDYQASCVVRAAGHAPNSAYFMPEDADRTVVVRLAKAGRVEGHVEFEGMEGDLPPMHFSLGCYHGGVHYKFRINPDGTFAPRDVAARTYECRPPFHLPPELSTYVAPPRMEVKIQEGQTTELELRFERGTRVSGTLVEAATGKRPDATCRVYVERADGYTARVKCEPDGSWELYAPAGDLDLGYDLKGQDASSTGRRLMVVKGTPLKGVSIEIRDERESGDT